MINKVNIKGLTDPLYLYAIITFVVGIIASKCHVDVWIVITIMAAGVVLLVTALIFQFYYGFKNPDYLRSENYQQYKQVLELLGDKDNSLNKNLQEIKYIPSPFNSATLSGGGSSNVNKIENVTDEP